MSEPTAAQPWTVTLAWTPDQNHGRVSTLNRRVPLYAIVGLLRGGETSSDIAADHDLTVEQVEVIRRLAEETQEWQP